MRHLWILGLGFVLALACWQVGLCIANIAPGAEGRSLLHGPVGPIDQSIAGEVVNSASAPQQYAITPMEGGFQSHNPGQHFLTQYGDQGFDLIVGLAGGQHRESLTLVGIGCGDEELLASGTPRQTPKGDRLDVDHGTFLMIYENSMKGMRHDLLVRDKPPGDGRLEARFRLEGDLLAVQTSADEVVFHHWDEQTFALVPKIRYSGLKAWDAQGRVLPSHMEVREDELVLAVDDRLAEYPVTIDPLSSTADLDLAGTQAGERFGSSVATAGDVNGDGYSDLLVGSPNWNTPAANAGRVQLFLGSSTGLAATPAWTCQGTMADARVGTSVSTAGDLNGDGISDVVIGAPGMNSSKGAALIFLGSATGLGATPFATYNGENNGDQFGFSVALAGDVNGDGFSDVLVGAPRYSSRLGKAYCYYGGTSLSFVLGWARQGGMPASQFGFCVTGAGDLNGDGYSDVAIGAPFENKPPPPIPSGTQNVGAVYLFAGATPGLNTTASQALKPATGANSYAGYSVCSAGDMNGDGYADLLVGVPGRGSNTGAVYLYSGVGGTAALVNGPPAASLVGLGTGAEVGQRLGQFVGLAGDVNGDGYSDVVVGRPGYSSGKGRVQVHLGGPVPSFDLADPYWKFTGAAANDSIGAACYTAGDVNGDGISDVAAGLPGQSAGTGAVKIFHGSPALISTTPAWSVIGSQDYEGQGLSIATAGDVNGDGYADMVVSRIVGAGFPGEVRLYLGGLTGPAAVAAWTRTGEHADDRYGQCVAGAGDVNGDGYSDVLVGAPGFRRSGDPVGTWRGKVYLYLGSSSGLGTTPAWTMEGEAAEARLGWSLASAGDVNGDGYSDVILGAYTFGRGKAYVYQGSAAAVPLPSVPDWTATGTAATVGNFASDVSTAGDVNGDGYDDVIIGDPYWESGTSDHNQGAAFVFHGSATGLSIAANWALYGAAHNYYLGASVSYAGDVNGDGYSDVIVGAPQDDNVGDGLAYVYHGSPVTGLGAVPATILAGSSPLPPARFGVSVSAAGDVNGDGFADVIIGSSGYTQFYQYQGAALLYLGSAAGVGAGASLTLSPLSVINAGYGFGVSLAGDVNGDGYGDVLVSARNPNTLINGGGVYLYMGNEGSAQPFRTLQYRSNLSTPVQTSNGTFQADCDWGIGQYARYAMGRSKVKLAWDQYGHGPSIPFQIFDNNSTAVVGESAAWTDSGLLGQLIKQTMTAPTGSSHPVWRVRVRHHPATALDGRMFGRWFTQGINDKQVPSVKTNLIGCGPLPVSLLDFSVKCEGGRAVLEWATASEQNCEQFIVQRSADAMAWSDMGAVPGGGNTSQVRYYRFEDTAPESTISYYRLKQIDSNGAYELLPMFPLLPCGQKGTLSAWPNPFTEELHIRAVSGWHEAGVVQVSVHDVTGRIVMMSELPISATGVVSIKAWEELRAGQYLIELSTPAAGRIGQVRVTKM